MTDVLSTLQQLVPPGNRQQIANRLGTVDVEELTDPPGTRLTYRNPNDFTIPIGTWTLRLLPRDDPVAGGTRLVIDLLHSSGDVTEVRMQIARFELEADPNHLTPGNLRTEPFTHIVPAGPAARRVRLLGPGLTVGLRGTNLSEPFLTLTGATGGVEPALPSLRFDPPHFLVGRGAGLGDLLGVACDEALLDLSATVSPPSPSGSTLGPTWTGLFLKDLGVFLNNDPGNDTWSFMARMQNFFVGFEGFDLSGTLSAELVHHVVDTPQVALTAVWEDDDGDVEALPNTPLPAPAGGRSYRRVRLSVRPSWDSAGYSVDWQLPDGVAAEEPLRLDQPDVGWLRVEPGTHTVTVEVTDHRVTVPPVQQLLSVSGPSTSTPTAVALEAAAVVIGAGADGDGEPHRVHVNWPRGAPLKITARLTGGDPAATSATFTIIPGGVTVSSGAVSQTVSRIGAGFPPVEWRVAATSASAAHGAVGVQVQLAPGPTGNTTTGTYRLRYRLFDPPTGNVPDFTTQALTDWLSDPGAGLIRLALFGGLTDDQVGWTIQSRALTEANASATETDAFFEDTATWPAPGETITPSLTGNVARCDLHTQDRLWRVTATAGGDPASDRLVLVGDERTSGRLAHPPLATIWREANRVQVQGPPTPFRFAFNSAGLQDDNRGVGADTPGETATAAWTHQALGAQALLAEIARAGSDLSHVHLVGAASAEGSAEYNIELALRRANAVKGFLEDVRDGLPVHPGLGPPPAGAATALTGTTITTASAGELGASGGVRQGAGGSASGERVVPDDRRVVAVLQIAGQVAPPTTRYAYFRTAAGARPIAAPAVVARRVPSHPFKHAIFRQAHLEVELLRGDLMRAQVRLTLDLKKFNDSDGLAPAGGGVPGLNPQDGITTFFLEYKKIIEPAGTRWTWDAAVLADPSDRNGLAITPAPVARAIGPSLITMPAITAFAGGQVGSGAALGAVALGAALASLGVFNVSSITWQGFRGRVAYGQTSQTAIRIGADYTVEYAVNVDLGPLGRLQTDPARPLRVTFRNLGVTWTAPDRFDLDYDPMEGFALRVDDPGVFRLGDGIGRLLRPRNAAVGGGQSPLWVEVELELAIETGVFAIDTLKVRLSVDSEQLFERGPDGRLKLVSGDWLSAVTVTISKIGISANLPGVLEGRGQLEISSGGVAGDLDVDLVPLHLGLGASFAMFSYPPDRRAVYLGIQARFRPGFPLGSTGVALYGLMGLTGVNIGRSVPEPDRVLDWYKGPPVGVVRSDKWRVSDGAWVFGVGATLGTAPDGGLLWNTAGALLVQTPGPQILLAADSQFLSPTSDPETPLSAGLQTVILLDFENGVFLAAAELSLNRAPLIELTVPAEIFFNLRRSVDWHIHLGKWEPEDKRVRARIFGGIFDAWSYIQVEGDGFTGPVTLEGLCVAHGMRTSLLWGSRGARIYFEAWVEYHLGLQLSPLYVEGVLNAGGELHLGPVSIGADVTISAKVGKDPDILSLRGKACGHIKIWFVKIGGCVGVEIGDGTRTSPAPRTPLVNFSVIDVMTDAVVDRNAAPVDCALHLVFDQPVYDARGSAAAIDLGTPRRVQVSPELFYEYDLTGLSISPSASLSPAAWAQPALPDPDPSHADGARTLRLRAWEPTAFPKALNFSDGYEEQLTALLDRLCDKRPRPPQRCATFDDQPLGPGTHWRLSRPDLASVDVLAPGGGVLGAGATLPPLPMGAPPGAAVVPLPAVSFPALVAREKALRLPRVVVQSRESERAGGGREIGPVRGGPRWGDLDLRRGSRAAGTAVAVKPGDPVDIGKGLLDVVPGVEGKLSPDMLGAIVIRLPALVRANVFLLLPKRHKGGAYRFYDEFMNPVTPIEDLSTAAVVPATTSGPVAADEVRMIVYDGGRKAGGQAPPSVGWLVLWGTFPMRLPSSWDSATYLLQVCGITLGEWNAAQRLDEARDRTTTWLTQSLLTPAAAAMATSVPMLAPNTQYTVTGTIAWRRYRNATTSTTDGDGTFPINESFKTDRHPPHDIRRYIDFVDPASPDQPQYRAEPVVVRFASDGVDALFAAYGEQVVTRLKADLGGDSANMGRTEGRFTVAVAEDSFEQAFVDALGQASCIPGDATLLFPKTEIRTPHELTPNTGYTLTLVPRPLAEPGTMDPDLWDRALELAVESGPPGSVVHRSFLTASRWRTFAEHVAAYRAVVTSPGGPGHLLADSASTAQSALNALPSRSRGDLAVDNLLGTLVGGPVQLPAVPEVHWIWGLSSPAPDGRSLPAYTLLGLLLDGPEPLFRRRPDGTDSVDLSATGTPMGGAPSPLPVRLLTGTSGARAVLSVPLTGVAHLTLTLTYRRLPTDTPDAQTLTLTVPTAPGTRP